MKRPLSHHAYRAFPATAGFSLLEAVVALAVIGSTSIAALAAFGAELRTSERARVAFEAEALAEDRLAQLCLLEREELSPLPDSVARGAFATPWQAYEWVSEVGPLAGQPDLFDGSVTVSWPTGRYRVVTRLYRPPRPGGVR